MGYEKRQDQKVEGTDDNGGAVAGRMRFVNTGEDRNAGAFGSSIRGDGGCTGIRRRAGTGSGGKRNGNSHD